MNAVSKIHEFLRFGSVLGLERMNALLEKLGNPQDDLKVIHVAGTNGKGSICRYVYEVLQAGGYKTGLYTSPFLEVFNERIEFNGAYISDEDLEIYTDKVIDAAKQMVEEGLESPTEFEIVTAIAFLYFAEKQADYVVLEVGLGGTGDSTNVVKKPLACIIASISLDHTDRLGNTIEAIAREKAGIIKAGCPVISSTDDSAAREVIKARCEELHADFYDTSKLETIVLSEEIDGTLFNVDVLEGSQGLKIGMLGKHQIQNATAALIALRLLQRENKIQLSDEAILTGFAKAKQIGRFEIMETEPYVILDGAHNPDGSRMLKLAMDKYFAGKKILMVTGILADKDIDEVFENFTAITKDFVVTEPDNPRKMRAEELAGHISAKGGNCIIKEKPAEAVAYAKSLYGEYDVILITGSLYLIGEIRGHLHDECKKSNPVL
ncbi:MAG: bifunctional folylpolyglutamate synthase/dihydrofolate synthase [Firmicutes bacterium]|nr:bifunctional folylpolyglutamate synthase/dihydrofolate synthase [Bacillota bacterium]